MLKHPKHLDGPKGLVVPAHLNFGEFILEKMWSVGNRVALRNASTDENTTYREIVQQSINFAVSLTRMGVRKGDVIGLISENRAEFWGAVFGVAATGATLTAICPTYEKDELNNALNISKPKFIISSPSAYEKHVMTFKNSAFIEKVILFGDGNGVLYNDLAGKDQVKYEDFKCADVEGQTDTLFVLYSSGTTGLPKGVMLTHLNVITACCQPLSLDDSGMNFSISPWYHTMGLIGNITGMAVGRTNILLPKFEIDLYLKTIEKYKVTQLTVVPPVLVAVSKYPHKYNLNSVHTIYCGAAPLHKETFDAVFQTFPSLYSVMQGYGASETTFGVIKFYFHQREDAIRKPGSVGKVVYGITAKIVDIESGEPLGPNQNGEICIKGNLIMKGYVGVGRNNDFDDEGFYKSGDIGYYDTEGFFYVVDRLKELIKYKGFQVPPAELEALLLTHSSVKDVGVIGIPHEIGGEVPLAFVVIQPGCSVDEAELQKFVAVRLSNPKHLRGGVRFVSQIPKSQSGKILRKDLRKLYNTKSKL